MLQVIKHKPDIIITGLVGFIPSILKFFFKNLIVVNSIQRYPNEHFRYIDQSILKSLYEAGFRSIKIKFIGGSIFVCFYNYISFITNKVPLLNNILLVFCQMLDFIISLFSKSMKSIFPTGYFFQAKK